MTVLVVKVRFNEDGSVWVLRYCADRQTEALDQSGKWVAAPEFAQIPPTCHLQPAAMAIMLGEPSMPAYDGAPAGPRVFESVTSLEVVSR